MIHILPTFLSHTMKFFMYDVSFCACVHCVCVYLVLCLFVCVCVVSFRSFLACLQSYLRCLAAAPSHDPPPPSSLTPRPSLTPLHPGEENPTSSLPHHTPSALFCIRVTEAREGEESVTGQSLSTVTSSERTDTRRLLRRHRGHMLCCCVNRNLC